MPKKRESGASGGTDKSAASSESASAVGGGASDTILGVGGAAGNDARKAQMPDPAGPQSALGLAGYAEPSLPQGVGVRAGTELLDKDGKPNVGKLKYDGFFRLEGESGGYRTIAFKSAKELMGGTAPGGSYKVAVAKSATPQFEAVHDALFTEDPSVAHVKQGKVGDCYLMAAIISVVNQRPAFIKDMLTDNGDTVSVRLYRGHKSEQVTVQKSVVRLGGEDYFAKSSLWVQMIEKAYAAAGFGGKAKADLPAKKGGEPGHDYAHIQLGVADHAFHVLTGIAGSSTSITKSVASRDVAVKAGLSTKLDRAGADALDAVKSISDADWPAVSAWLGQAKGPAQDHIDALKKARKSKKKASGELTSESVLTHYRSALKAYNAAAPDKQVPAAVSGSVLTGLEGWLGGVAGGEFGSGKYSEVQLELFKEIDDGVNNGELLTLSTNSSLGDATTTGANGEGVVDGMLGGHAYSILASKTDGALRWIQVKDTYANFERKRADGQAQPPTPANEGVFWVELSELTREFSAIRKGTLPPPPAAFDEHKQRKNGSQVIDLHDHEDAYAHYSYDVVQDRRGPNKKANDHLTIENSLATLLAVEDADTLGVKDWRDTRRSKNKADHNQRLNVQNLTDVDNLHFRPAERKQGATPLTKTLDQDGSQRKATGSARRAAAPDAVAVDNELSLGAFTPWLHKVFDGTGVDGEISKRILASIEAVTKRMGVSADDLYLVESQRAEFAKFALMAMQLSGLSKAAGVTVPRELRGIAQKQGLLQIDKDSFDDAAFQAGLSPDLYAEIKDKIGPNGDGKWRKKEGEPGFAPARTFLLNRHWDTIRSWVVKPA